MNGGSKGTPPQVRQYNSFNLETTGCYKDTSRFFFFLDISPSGLHLHVVHFPPPFLQKHFPEKTPVALDSAAGRQLPRGHVSHTHHTDALGLDWPRWGQSDAVSLKAGRLEIRF